MSRASRGVMLGIFALAITAGLGCGQPSPTPNASQVSPASAPKPEAEPATESTTKSDPAASARPESDPAVQADTPAPVEVEPNVDLGAMSEKMARRLRSNLRRQVSARVELRVVETEAEEGGGHSVFALFEYSAFEACVGKAGGGKQARERCAEPLAGDLGVQLRACTELGLVHARFGPPPTTDPDHGGDLELIATQPVEAECVFRGVPRFAFTDADGDGQRELEVEIRSADWGWAFREQYAYEVENRRVGWYREDLSPQLVLNLDGCPGDIVIATHCGVGRYRFEDKNGDGHPDLALESVGYQVGAVDDSDEFGWPNEHPPGSEDDDDDWKSELDSHHEWIQIYDPGKDQWVAG